MSVDGDQVTCTAFGAVAVACTLPGTVGGVVSVDTWGTAGAKKASPAAQYIEAANVPPKLWGPGADRTWYPVARLAAVPFATWAWAV